MIAGGPVKCEHCRIRMALGILRHLTADGFIESFAFLCALCRYAEQDRAADPDALMWQPA